MKGIAGKLFQERKNLSEEAKKSRWPLLDQMMAAKRLGYIDLSLAHRFLNKESIEDEAAAALICHLSMAARKGHVCIKIKDGTVMPGPEEIWMTDDAGQLHEAHKSCFEELKKIILQASALEINSENIPIVRDNHLFYLQRYWHLESLFLSEMKQKIIGKIPTKPIDPVFVKNKIDQMKAEGKLLNEQAEAVFKASQSLFTLITGGPGTGKTYTAGVLLKTIWEILNDQEKANFTIALAAPTGKAAANLEDSIKKALKGVEGFPAIKAQTLHQLLGIKKNGYGRGINPLTADLVLIDESSMIDIKLMGQLFWAIKPGSRLILLGDKHQLASGEASVVELKTCMRSELKNMNDFADQIKAGNVEGAFKLLKGQGISWKELNSEKNVREQQKQLLDHVMNYFPIFNTLPDEPLDLLAQFNRFRILTPLRKGPFGADALNGMIFQAICSRTEKGKFIAPIMVMQNDYHLGLFNGEVGVIVKEKGKEFALFASREPDQKFRQIPTLLLPRYEYAYCLSIHKSQGSEFDHIVLLLPEGTETFGREALYTGVTRAKKHLEIWSQPKVLSQMITTAAERQSGIIERLGMK
jgi:exodeoxyribonuclease V alpha subunit